MKKFFFSALLLAGSLTATADDFQYLTLASADTESSIELASIHKITFDVQAGNVVVTTTEGEVRFPLAEMEKMFFSTTPTAIASMPVQSDNLKLANGKLQVKGDGFLRIYSVNGAAVRMAKVEGEMTVSLNNLPKGTYIVNMGKQTIKLQK